MEHPFIHNLKDKTLEELQEALSGLYKKLSISTRYGNRPLINQLMMAIESHRTQYDKKMNELLTKQKINTQINVEKQS
jgi:hypothetical protein